MTIDELIVMLKTYDTSSEVVIAMCVRKELEKKLNNDEVMITDSQWGTITEELDFKWEACSEWAEQAFQRELDVSKIISEQATNDYLEAQDKENTEQELWR